MDQALVKIIQGFKRDHKDLGGRPFGSFKLSIEDCKTRIEAWKETFKEGGERAGQVPTISSLAYDLGIARRTLVDYQHRDAYKPMLERAKTFCEMHSAQALFDPKIRPGGPIFNLKHNHGWKDGTENKGINFNFSWNAVQIEAEKVRKQLEEPDHTIERSEV